ncbi:hypothetical protein CVT24_001622 [Panaeolus cyanescens]|uniref:EF-hand domain-containing protein n=1 Tax=Panaeolus cyanescens TaxID=181874 RepID=A0A409YF62_9AGAR|nr:hypothetical protein CVT24_001622 [Panaeolus cyanescens]
MSSTIHALHGAYESLNGQRTTSRTTPAIERAESSTGSDALNPFKLVNDFFDTNLSSRSKESSSGNTEDVINGFADGAQIVSKGLHALGQLHPFIGVAVGAFVLVITLDLARRDNDRKVIAVKLQMQDLMMVFFELRHYRSSQERGKDGVTIAQRLEGLMITIAEDVKKCGSACDAYIKKGFLGTLFFVYPLSTQAEQTLAKTIKSTIYENRLAEFAETFMEHRRKLELAFALHSSAGIDDANEKLDHHTNRLRTIEKKLDMIAVFRQVETQRERELQKFITDNGGVKYCLNNDDLLAELVNKSGETISRIGGKETSRKTTDLHGIRKKLFKELMEDIDEVFNRNMVLFEKKLDMHGKQMQEVIQSESDHIINSLLAGAHDRIIDPDLQRIWKDMGWKGSVKARHFVLALHDYYADQLSQGSGSPISPSHEKSPLMTSRPTPKRTQSIMMKRQDDKWALAYITAAYVQPILEAVDDDGTGFVSVKEVNTFVSEKPDGWSLPHWIAYWAVGWQASISIYKNKIYSLVQTMFKTLEHIMPSNRRAVDEYLFHASFWRIELLLRSTRSVNPKIFSDSDLMRITENFSISEEDRLEQNLIDVAYELDSLATVSLVTGEGRIERFAFPLIYLLLRRHLKVLTLACKHVLDTEELSALNESLVSVLLSIDYRIHNLEAIFKQTHLDVQARFGNFAFGMFQLSCGDIKRIPINNSFASWTEDGEGVDRTSAPLTAEKIQYKLAQISKSILKYGIQDAFHSTNYYEFEPARLRKTSHPVQGTWTGHCAKTEGAETITYILRLSFRLDEDRKKLLGKGEDFSTTFELEGQVKRGVMGHEFTFSVIDDEDGRKAAGVLDSATGTITIGFTDKRQKDNPDEPCYKMFQLRRTPPSLLRYRYTSDQFAEDPVRSRWSFACSAALHQAQERLWSRRFFETRFSERKRFVELSTRNLIVHMGLTPQQPLNSTELGELEYLRRDLNPSEARFYHALSEFEIQKLPWHPAWGCDWCGRRITKCRVLCMHCMSEDLSDNIDLCGACMDKTPAKRGFTHELSHDVIKVEETLHDFYFARVVEAARAQVGQAKNVFRMMETNEEGGNVRMSVVSDNGHQVLCVCCAKPMSTPCWACVICAKDVFICTECDRQRISPPPLSSHKLNHPLIRIRDTSIMGPDATAEERISALQQRVINLEHKLSTRLAVMDAKVEERLMAMEQRVEQRLIDFEAKAELRFDTLEALMKQLVAQTAALPSIYTQIVKDQVRNSMPTTPTSPRWFQSSLSPR